MSSGAYMRDSKLIAISVLLFTSVFVVSVVLSPSIPAFSISNKKNVTLTVILNEFSHKEWGKSLIQRALDDLRLSHPDFNIQMKYLEFPYHTLRQQLLNVMANQTPIDIVSVDQIWLGDFAEKGYLTDLTNYTKKWGRSNEWYQQSWGGGAYNNTIYGIWAWTDVRGIWYWKDLLDQASINPNSLKTWDGYIESAKKLNSVLGPKGIEGIHLTAASHSPDLWYPYLWMLNGEIAELRDGHPTKGRYWFPTYNSTQGVEALQFIGDQVTAGIKPQRDYHGGQEFADRNFAVMIDGSWILTNIPAEGHSRLGFIPMFPVPDNNTKTSTLMGGWEFAIPKTSVNKGLAWELIENMMKPKILSPWIAKSGYLPTQITIGEGAGPYAGQLRRSIPYYDEMVSMIPIGKGRPSFAEYPAIAEDIRHAIDDVYNGTKNPKQALDDAAAKSAKVLGW
jgi:multiple sugar transport system substrate-binding protein